MARRKAGDNQVKVGNVTDVSGEVNIAGRDIYKGYTPEQVSVLLTQITTTLQPKPFDGRCPYKGLEVFREEDAELFFGREKLVEELFRRVKGSRTVFITGPSGSGKSSLVRAGLIPGLKQGAIKDLYSQRWLYETLKPGREPMVELGRVAASITGTLNAGEDIRTKGLTDASLLAQWCEIALKDDRQKRVVLFIDQFEEVFTQTDKEAERLSFLNLLTHAATVEKGRVILLFAMRSDFLPNCASYPELNALLSQQFIQIGAMRPKELVSAIAQPALSVGLQIDPDLVAQIINDMEGAPGALPLMQFALKDLFDSQQAKGGLIALRLYDYNERGGIHEALERHADASFAELNQHEQELARSIFSGLIAVGHGTQDTRRTAPFNELVPANANAQDVGTVVQKLADARLITTEEGDNSKYTITHEKLISSWTWLEKLINENRAAIDLQNEIANDAKEWEDHQRDPSYLYTGARLASAREKLDANKIVLSGLAQLFIETGVQAYADELEAAKQRTTQLRRRSVYLTTALVAALLAVGIAIFFSVQSQRQAKISSARELAATSITTLDLDPDLSLRLALQSLSETRTSQGEEALQRALVSPPVQLTLLGHSGAVYSVAYSHDGKRLVTASQDGTARIWDAATGQELLALRGHIAAVNSAAFSPDGKLVATAGADKTVRIWDAKTGQQMLSIDKHSAAVNSVAFSPNAQYIVTASDDKTARVWQVTDGRQVQLLDKHTAAVRCALFSPDGKLIATGGYDQTINFWDATTGQLTSSISNDSQNVDTIAFSPDSQYVLADWVYNAYRWDIASGTNVAEYFGGHTWYVTSVAFNPLDGSQVATGSADQTVRIWDTESGNELEIMRGQSGAIYSVAFDPAGDHLAAASDDQTVRIWNIGEWRKRVLIEPAGYFIDAAYSSDGSKIATAGSDGMIRIWEAATG
ncbi:MAG TPA: WD40 repeat domain-containing protein, partial [Anaerolineales bacterium]